MEPLFLAAAIVVVCGVFVFLNREAYKDWKSQSFLKKNVLFIQAFGFVLFSLLMLIVLIWGDI